MKKMLSFLLTFVMLLSLCSVTAFATDESLLDAKCELKNLIEDIEDVYIERSAMVPPTYPNYSVESEERLINAVEKTSSEMDSYTSVEEVNEAADLLNSCVEQLDFHEDELKFMLDLMKADYEDKTYYDAETSAEIKEIYETAQAAYESKEPKAMNKSYIALRNELDKLCLAVTVVGDVNNDGEFSIQDVTLIQKYLADSVQLTSAQRFAGGLDDVNIEIRISTQFMKALADPDNAEEQKSYHFVKHMYINHLATDYKPNPDNPCDYINDCHNNYYAYNRYSYLFWWY